jgi:hypothetical protein
MVFLGPSRQMPLYYLDWGTSTYFQILPNSQLTDHPAPRRCIAYILTALQKEPQKISSEYSCYTGNVCVCRVTYSNSDGFRLIQIFETAEARILGKCKNENLSEPN